MGLAAKLRHVKHWQIIEVARGKQVYFILFPASNKFLMEKTG